MNRVPAASGTVTGWWLPAAPGVFRPALGVSAGLGQGPIEGDNEAWVGTAVGRGALLWKVAPQVGLGPALGVGTTWRSLASGIQQAQGAPLAEFGLHTSVDLRPVWIGLDVGARTWQVDAQWVAHPSAGLTLGAAF
jgi:hypothetical protein